MHRVDRLLVGLLAGAMLLPCGACAHAWRFAPGDATMRHAMPEPRRPAAVHRPPVASRAVAASCSNDVPPATAPSAARTQLASTPSPVNATPCVTLLPPVDCVSAQPVCFSPEVAEFASACDPAEPPCDAPCYRPRLRSLYDRALSNVDSDFKHYFCRGTLRDMALAVSFGSVLANTELDESFDDWYQDDVRSSGTDGFVRFWKPLGEGRLMIPAFVGLGLLGCLSENRPVFDTAGELGGRISRSYLIGAPPMLFMQFVLGASRPGETRFGSHWKPFDDDNSVSGHTFIGAVPLITVAQMTDNPWVKSCLYVCSTFTGWSRINDHKHYLSQVGLGWWMAYMSCRAVNQTECEDQCLTFSPVVTPEMAGFAMMYQR